MATVGPRKQVNTNIQSALSESKHRNYETALAIAQKNPDQEMQDILIETIILSAKLNFGLTTAFSLVSTLQNPLLQRKLAKNFYQQTYIDLTQSKIDFLLKKNKMDQAVEWTKKLPHEYLKIAQYEKMIRYLAKQSSSDAERQTLNRIITAHEDIGYHLLDEICKKIPQDGHSRGEAYREAEAKKLFIAIFATALQDFISKKCYTL